MASYETVDAREKHPSVDGSTSSRRPQPAPKSHLWIWVLVMASIAGGYWYFRGRTSQANATAGAAGAAPAGSGGGPKGGLTVPVVVATAQKGDLPVYFNGLGTVTAFNTVTVRSRIDGQLINVTFKEGQLVQAGQVLAEIDPRPYQVQLDQALGQLAKDEAQLKDAQVNLERYQLLFKEGVIAKQQLDTQQASVGQFDGAITTDKANISSAKLNLNYCRITAPITGRVGLRLVDAGNMVHATDTNGLLVITQLQPISVLFSLPQDQLPAVYSKLRAGQQLIVEAFDRDNIAKVASGKLLTIDNQIDATTGTYKLKSTFSNSDNALFPNQFVNVHLLVDTRKDVVIVPSTAVLRGAQGTYVFAVGADNVVKVRNIAVAETTGEVTGITSGIAPGDLVVTDGQDKLQDGSKVEPRRVPAAPTAPTTSGKKSAAASSSFVSPGGGSAR